MLWGEERRQQWQFFQHQDVSQNMDQHEKTSTLDLHKCVTRNYQFTPEKGFLKRSGLVFKCTKLYWQWPALTEYESLSREYDTANMQTLICHVSLEQSFTWFCSGGFGRYITVPSSWRRWCLSADQQWTWDLGVFLGFLQGSYPAAREREKKRARWRERTSLHL